MKKITLLIFLILFTFSLYAQNKHAKMLNFKLTDLNGKTYELKKILGKGPIIIDFWATWCEPCLKELPELSKLQEKYKNIQVFAISVDKARMLNKVKREVKSHKYKFITLFDKNGSYQKRMNIQNIPQTYLLDKNGNIVYHHEGFNTKEINKLENALKKLLKIESKKSNIKSEAKK